MPIRIGVIGAGRWGPNLARNFESLQRSQLRCVVDSDPERCAMVRKQYPDIDVYSDAEQAITNDEVDAIVVATPTVTHYDICAAALEAGKHVLVEKPLTRTSEQGQKLVEIAQKNERVLMVGHVFLFNGAIRRMKQYVAEGELGRTLYIAATRTNFGPIRMDVNAAWDLATHDISIANYLLDAMPTSVSATGGSWINAPVEDAVFVNLRYPGDVMVHLHASWLHPRKARGIEIVGDRRMLTFDDLNTLEPIRIYDNQVKDDTVSPPFIDTISEFRAAIRQGEVWVPNVTLGEPLKTECDAFLDAVTANDRGCISNGEFGVDVVRVLEAIDRSMAAGGSEEAL